MPIYIYILNIITHRTYKLLYIYDIRYTIYIYIQQHVYMYVYIHAYMYVYVYIFFTTIALSSLP